MRRLAAPFRVIALPIMLLVPGWTGLQYASGNIHRVGPDLVRSGQLAPDQLDRLIRRDGIRSVLNLRGAHPEAAWWRREAQVAARRGVAYRSFAISARSEPDDATMDALAALLARMPKPLLVHCWGGADRSGLAAALFELTVAGEDAAKAGDQLSIRYGHVPWFGSATGAMDKAFARFAARVARGREQVAETSADP